MKRSGSVNILVKMIVSRMSPSTKSVCSQVPNPGVCWGGGGACQTQGR